MTAGNHRWVQWRNRSEWRLVLLGVFGVLAVYLGFIGLEAPAAEYLITRWGYYFMAATFVWWGTALWRLFRASRVEGPGGPAWTRREVGLVVGVIAILMASVLGMETLRSKILYDEYVLQATAYNMHYFREAATMVRGYELLGTFVSTDNYLDKRPYFYPFLISLVHDVSGYRPLNAHLLNVLLMPIGLGLAYHLGRRWHGWKGGLVAVVLLGTLPLFGQNATGSGMEMINAVMLLLAIALGGRYLDRPDARSLSALVLTVVLLAQCRYESAIFVLPGMALVLLGWWRANGIILPSAAMVSPLLLLPTALHNKVLSASPVLWEMKEDQTSRFGWEYVPDNARGVVEFAFSTGTQMANSPWLSLLGGVAMLVVLGRLLARRLRWRQGDGTAWAWLFFAVGIGANLVIVLFYFWSRFTDPMAARFSLPLYLLLVFASVLLVRWSDRRGPATWIVVAVAVVAYLGWGVPKHAHHLYSRMGVDEIEWERRYVASLPPKSRIMLTNKTSLVWLLDKTPSILLDRAQQMEDRLVYQLSQPTFQEILVAQSLRPAARGGHHQVVPEEVLPERFELELMTEKRFGTKLARISRLVAIHPRATPATSADE